MGVWLSVKQLAKVKAGSIPALCTVRQGMP